MNLKRLLWFNGYKETFDSPYPIEKCVEILRDHSAYDYIRTVKKAMPYGFLTTDSLSLMIDVHPQTDGRYGFIIQYITTSHSRKTGDNTTEYRGTLESIETGTRVSGKVNNILANIGCLFLFLIGIASIIIMAMASVYDDAGIPSVLVGIVVIILTSLWVMLTYAGSDIIDYPKRLLSGHIPPRPDDIVPAWWNIFKRSFHFYTDQSLATCIQKLEGEAYHPHYQACGLGMIKGKISTDHYFIAFEPTSDDKVYFCIDDNGLSSFNQMSEYLLGTLTTEGDGTRITGVTGYRLGELWVFAPIWIIITAVLSVIYMPLGIGVGGMLILLGIASVRWEVAKLAKIPAQKVLGTHPQKQKSGWGGLRRDIDFSTPYPIEDCYNMLFDYAPPDDFSYTQWGNTPGNLLDGWLFIGTYHQDEGHLDFVVKSVDKGLAPKIKGEGSFKTEGNRTHITGQFYSVDGWGWLFQVLILPLFMTSFSIWLINLFYPLQEMTRIITLFVLGVGFLGLWIYILMIRRIHRAKIALESRLDTGVPRKRKVADELGGE
mgnify:CR=1 FL=1